MKKVMRNKKVIAMMVVGLVAIFLATSGVIASPPMGSGDPPVESKINYQGQLTDPVTGDPLSGNYDMQFQFYDAATGGSQVGTPISKSGVQVTDGLFNVKLDVNQADFNGQGLWLEVKVEGETLSPRQEILPVPYALSLVPGAEINGEGTPGNAVLSVTNNGSGYGGWFESCNDGGCGVYGLCSNSGEGYNFGVFGESYGEQGRGVFGVANGDNGKGVFGVASHGYGGYFASLYGTGIYAYGTLGGYAADFRGNVIIRTWVTGDPVVELGEGLDYAEGFDVSDNEDIAPGSVLIIDPDNPGKLALSDEPYDSKVAGIVAGAKEFGSGVRLGPDQFDYDVALAGRVYCNVDATESAVEPGDLLTTSATPGYAMKVTDYGRAQGAILGKAMEGLEKGQTGQILVLVTLQ